MNDADWYKESNDAFVAACPLTGRVVHGEGKRSQRYNFGPNKKRQQGTPTCYFCPGQEQTQLPEVCRIEGVTGAKHMVTLTPPEAIDASWVTRVFPNLYKTQGNIGRESLKEAWQEQYKSEQGRRHLMSVCERLQEKGIAVEDEAYYFDLGHLVVVGTREHNENSNGEVNNLLLGAEQSSLELRTAIHARNLAYQDQRVLFGFIYRNIGRRGGATQTHEHMQIRSLTHIAPDGELGKQIEVCTKDPERIKRVIDIVRKEKWVYLENPNVVCFAVPWLETDGVWIVYTGEKSSFDAMDEQEIDLFNEATQETLRRLYKHGYMDLNLGLFDAPRMQAKQLPVHAKVITCKKVRGATDKMIGPDRNDRTPNQLKELLSNA